MCNNVGWQQEVNDNNNSNNDNKFASFLEKMYYILIILHIPRIVGESLLVSTN